MVELSMLTAEARLHGALIRDVVAGFRMVAFKSGPRWGCEDSSAARDFLREHGLRFEEVDIDKNPEALAFVMGVNQGKQRTPTFDVDGQTFHSSHFDPRKLVRELGLQRAFPDRKGAGTRVRE